MLTFLLVIIYIAFISLGLPDPMLGAAWPVMYEDLGAQLSSAGIVTFIVSAGTICSSLLSDRITKKLGPGLVTATSVALTAIAIFGYSVSGSFWQLCLWAIPYGLGAGGVDAALNNFVAIHYSSRAMSWLHAFWGVGTMTSPFLMSFALSKGFGWEKGFVFVGILQVVLCAVLFASLPAWKKVQKMDTGSNLADTEEAVKPLGLKACLSIPNVPYVLISFLCYCSFESTAIFWSSSFLVGVYDIEESTAAAFGSLFCIGITAGRFLTGFIANKLGDTKMVRLGVIGMGMGTLLLFAGWLLPELALAGLVLMGFGCAPVFPSLIHATPSHFGKKNSQAIVGVQMACAYIGSAVIPPLFGVLADYVAMELFPFYLAFFYALLLIASETLRKKVKEHPYHE